MVLILQIFDNYDTMVPAVPTAHLVSGSTGPSGSTSEKAGSMSISSVTGMYYLLNSLLLVIR